jgi:hypothetical protein
MGKEHSLDDQLNFVTSVLKLKKKVLDKKLSVAWTWCPRCKTGRLNARISPYNKHIHAACNNPECKMVMME